MTIAIVALLVLLVGIEAVRLAVEHRAGVAHVGAAQPPVDPLAELIAHRYIVTLRGDEGTFAGVLTEAHNIVTHQGQLDTVLTLEQCSTMPTGEGDTPAEIAGRVILEMSGIAYLQQVS